jgi:hypothetical protein
MAPHEIEEMLRREGSKVSPDQYDESTEPAEARQRRTGLLVPILAACREVWVSEPDELELMVEKLGDGSRDGELLSGNPMNHNLSKLVAANRTRTAFTGNLPD